MDSSELLRLISIVTIPAVSAITVHEWAHGYVANLRGDRSAKILGRLSFNPIKHIDPVGTIIVPIVLLVLNFGVLFGWAKPVPVNEHALKNPRWDMALVAIAGPASNVVMAIIWAIAHKYTIPANNFTEWLYQSSAIGIMINAFLACLNMLPILPLDGGRILSALLPRRLVYYYDKTEDYGFFILIGLLFLGVVGSVVTPITHDLISLINHLLS